MDAEQTMPDWVAELQQRQGETWTPTRLTPQEEPQFRQWMYNTQLFNAIKDEIAQENGVAPEKLDNERVLQMLEQSGDYDYRGAFRKGITETVSPHDGRPHWPSRADDGAWLKSPQHETAWKEIFMQRYGIDPDDAGLDTLDKAVAATRDAKVVRALEQQARQRMWNEEAAKRQQGGQQ